MLQVHSLCSWGWLSFFWKQLSFCFLSSLLLSVTSGKVSHTHYHSRICSYKNLGRSKPTLETWCFNNDFDQQFCFALPSVLGCFHSTCKGILGDKNKDLYLKCGIWGDLERKINWVKCLDLIISCWERIFFQLGRLFWRTEKVVELCVSLVSFLHAESTNGAMVRVGMISC